MDISEEVVPDLVASDILEQNQKPDSTFQEAKSFEEGISRIVRSGNGASDITISDRLQQNHNPDSQVHELESNQEKDISMASLKNGNSDGHSMLHEESLNREGTADVIPGDGISEEVASDELKQSKSPELRAHDIQVSQEGISSTVRPEKALEDGYNWRKYGQKNVRGNEFIRSYYKCTHHTCLVKKQVERSHDGQILDTLYLGTHDHPKAQPISVAAGSSSSIQEEKMGEPLSGVAEKKSSNEHVQTSHQIESTEVPRLLTVAVSETDPRDADSGSNRIQEEVYNHENLEPKRRKQDSHNVDATRADKQTGESRIVVRTTSEVDIVNDGYRWRKYGQKLVKGNPNPRSYYRCSSAGCPVKKQVERASHDPKVVITTYEKQHDHDMPPARTVTPNTLGSNTNPTVSNDESRAESEETDLVGHEVIVQYSLNLESSRSNEHRRPEAAPVHS